ncbi:MAG: hypothetical protein ACR2MS_02345 [Weeksellaceae bacterium]
MIQVPELDLLSPEVRKQIVADAASAGYSSVAMYALKQLEGRYLQSSHKDVKHLSLQESDSDGVQYVSTPSPDPEMKQVEAKVQKEHNPNQPVASANKNDTSATIESLDVSGYCYKPLLKAGIVTVQDALNYLKTGKSLSEIKRFGASSQEELMLALAPYLAAPTPDDDDWTEDPEEEVEDDFEEEEDSYEDEEEEDLDDFDNDEEDEESYYMQTIGLPADKEGMKLAASLYVKAWDFKDKEEGKKKAREIVSGIFDPKDQDSYGESIAALAKAMPKTTIQHKRVLQLMEELGETDHDVFVIRATACAGKEYSQLTHQETLDLLSEMKDDLDEVAELADDDFMF